MEPILEKTVRPSASVFVTGQAWSKFLAARFVCLFFNVEVRRRTLIKEGPVSRHFSCSITGDPEIEAERIDPNNQPHIEPEDSQ
jgi:hypothetical protein